MFTKCPPTRWTFGLNLILAPGLGFEPRLRGPEPRVLPLYDPGIIQSAKSGFRFHLNFSDTILNTNQMGQQKRLPQTQKFY